MIIECPVSLGELVDKISILKIKQVKIKDSKKNAEVSNELDHLEKKLKSLGLEGIEIFLKRLVDINTKLWEIEDDIREEERKKEFSDHFIKLARSVYVTNDQRFEVKNEINHNSIYSLYIHI